MQGNDGRAQKPTGSGIELSADRVVVSWLTTIALFISSMFLMAVEPTVGLIGFSVAPIIALLVFAGVDIGDLASWGGFSRE